MCEINKNRGKTKTSAMTKGMKSIRMECIVILPLKVESDFKEERQGRGIEADVEDMGTWQEWDEGNVDGCSLGSIRLDVQLERLGAGGW